MRLLLDENLPKRLKQDLSEHEIYTANERGWTGISNGKLLELLTYS
jgi:predicted nuclease of predicted toxin-antitoxin system